MDIGGLDDHALMARIALGDKNAFAILVRRYQQSLLNFFRRMGARTDEAEDMAQETFLRVFGYRARYAPSGKFSNFIFVLARHAWADAGRRAKRRPEIPSDLLDENPAGGEAACRSGSRSNARVDARLDVERALETLSEKLRAVVVLGVLQGLEYRDVARVLDIPVGTVKSRLHLAMRGLREAFDVETE